MTSQYELYHHGVKGMKWGVRRYQYADGSLTPAGKNRIRGNNNKISYSINKAKTIVTGKQYVDGYLNKGTTFSRIQTSDKYEKYAFYATYKKSDQNRYLGLFGSNLINRANKEANKDIKIYQAKFETIKKMKIPSDENAADITHKLLRDKEFNDNLKESIIDSKSKMKRPTQQVIFNQALKSMNKHPDEMNKYDKTSIYKAFNLSLVNHNDKEIAAQNRFYTELKKKGYNALLDYNDKEYSSYHAKRPMIIFDTDSVKLSSITETNPKVINKLNTIYNADRLVKEVSANTIGYIAKQGSKPLSECEDYIYNKLDAYLK